MSLPSDLVDIINAIAEPDEYRHQAAEKQAIHDYAVAHLAPVSSCNTRVNIEVNYENGTASAIDRLTLEVEAEQRAADIAANLERYTLQNQYLSLCDTLTGKTTHEKLGFAELQAIITAMQETQPMQAMTLALQLLTLNAALVRAGGVQWWDNCEWTVLP